MRDRFGDKPLYYGYVNDNFIFGSELKALKTFPGFSREINRNAVSLLMKYSYIPSPHSIYKGINKLPQGSYISLDSNQLNKQIAPEIKKYWSAESVFLDEHHCQRHFDSDAEAIDELDLQLRNSIKRQMISDMPLGAFLSGGIDSSTIVSLMQDMSNSPIKTFSIGFSDRKFDESIEARRIAKHLGTDHTSLIVTKSNLLDVIPMLPIIYDEPFSDSSQIPTILVSKLAKTKVSVALSGDGGDELFGGYNRYALANLVWRRLKIMPYDFRFLIAFLTSRINSKTWDHFYHLVKKILPKNYNIKNFGDKVRKCSALIKAKNYSEVYDQLVSHW